MDASTLILHQTLIRLGKGVVKGWETWLMAKQQGLRPDVLQLQATLIRNVRRGILKPWEDWVQGRAIPSQNAGTIDQPRHLTNDHHGAAQHRN